MAVNRAMFSHTSSDWPASTGSERPKHKKKGLCHYRAFTFKHMLLQYSGYLRFFFFLSPFLVLDAHCCSIGLHGLAGVGWGDECVCVAWGCVCIVGWGGEEGAVC